MENYKTWAVGDEVECIDDEEFENVLIVGRKYKIKRIHSARIMFKGEIAMQICICINGVNECMVKDRYGKAPRYGFSVRRFRKLQKRKTDISVFTAMLNQTELTNKIELEVKERMPENV